MLILAVNDLAVNGALPLDIVSESVLAILHSVKKCLIDSLSVLFEVPRRTLVAEGSGTWGASSERQALHRPATAPCRDYLTSCNSCAAAMKPQPFVLLFSSKTYFCWVIAHLQ